MEGADSRLTEDGMEYICENMTEATKNKPGGHRQSDHDYSKNRMYDDNAVVAFKLYKN